MITTITDIGNKIMALYYKITTTGHWRISLDFKNKRHHQLKKIKIK